MSLPVLFLQIKFAQIYTKPGYGTILVPCIILAVLERVESLILLVIGAIVKHCYQYLHTHSDAMAAMNRVVQAQSNKLSV